MRSWSCILNGKYKYSGEAENKESMSFDIVKSVNGNPVKSIRELDTAFESNSGIQESVTGKFVSLQTENGIEIVLDKTNLKEIDERIQKKFGIERLKNY